MIVGNCWVKKPGVSILLVAAQESPGSPIPYGLEFHFDCSLRDFQAFALARCNVERPVVLTPLGGQNWGTMGLSDYVVLYLFHTRYSPEGDTPPVMFVSFIKSTYHKPKCCWSYLHQLSHQKSAMKPI